MPRGRLIYPFTVEIARLDTAATAADPDGAGPLTSGYDEDFREPVKVPVTGKQTGVSARKELAPIKLPAQIEPDLWEGLAALAGGTSPQFAMSLVLHFIDLESNSLVDLATGDALIRTNDRLVSIRNINTDDLIQLVPNPPGLFVSEVQPRGFGLGPDRNLLLVKFQDREQSVRSP